MLFIVSAVAAQPLYLQLMIFDYESAVTANIPQFLLKRLVFVKRYDTAALQAGHMVVMPAERIGQLQLILPADLQALHDAKFLEQTDRSINTGAVGTRAGGYKLLHGLRLLSV